MVSFRGSPTLPDHLFTAWCRALVVLILAMMSRCAPKSEVSRSRVSLDDFGSGYSSLNYVKDLPVDDLKIDKSFIDGLGEDAVNDAIVRLIVDFAHTLGLKVTAEGVENDRQVSSLTAMRCDLAQGFYFSKPLAGEAAGALVATNHPSWQVPG